MMAAAAVGAAYYGRKRRMCACVARGEKLMMDEVDETAYARDMDRKATLV